MRPHPFLVVLALSGALLSGCGASTNKATGARVAKPVVLTLANPNAVDADVGEWMQAVERLSHGTVRIELRSDWRSDEVQAERGTLRDVRAGRVDLAKIPARAWDTLGVKSLQALQAPLLVDSLELEQRVLTSALGAEMLAGVRAAGVEPVAVLPGPLRYPLGVTRDLVGAANYRGAQIGSRPSAVAAATVSALGGRYVEVAAGGSLSGLDGFDASLADVDIFGYDEQARSVTADVVLWPRAATIVANREAWERLALEQRAALTDAARAAVDPLMSNLRDFQRGGIQSLCKQRFTLVRAGSGGLAALRRAVEPVYRELEADSGTRRALARIGELKDDTPVEPVASCQSESAAPPARATGPLVGTWHAHVTRELLERAHGEVGESAEDNYGDLTLLLGADGRFEILNARFPGEPGGFGSWSIKGSVLEMKAEGSVEQGGGQTWRYRWTLFHGSLVLRKAPQRGPMPTPLVVAPFRRG
jgi:TRAP-type C4-dicarboxylate transport system substrate-binding protein